MSHLKIVFLFAGILAGSIFFNSVCTAQDQASSTQNQAKQPVLDVTSIDIDPRCTVADPTLFSHRRGAPTGRLASLVWME